MDYRLEAKKCFLEPGALIVTTEYYMISVVLGSCVSVCLWDTEVTIAAMCHYVLASSEDNERRAKYGEIALTYMLSLMKQAGATSESMRAHVIGGGSNALLGSRVGDENVMLADKFLHKANIAVATRDVGGQTGRKVVFNTATGEVSVLKGIAVRKSDWH